MDDELLLDYNVWAVEPQFLEYGGYQFNSPSAGVLPRYRQNGAKIITNPQLDYDVSFRSQQERGGQLTLRAPSFSLEEDRALGKAIRESTSVEILEALYVTTVAYRVWVSFPNWDGINELDSSSLGYGISSINALSRPVRSTVELAEFDLPEDPTLIPFNESPYALFPDAISWRIGASASIPNAPAIPLPENHFNSFNADTAWYRVIKSSNFDGVYAWITQYPTRIRFITSGQPHYIHLLGGHPRDNRTVADYPVINPTVSETIKIKYYRENKLEDIADLQTIDYLSYECDLTENVPYTLPIKDCTLGTLNISSQNAKDVLIDTLAESGKYPYKYYFRESLPELFARWRQLLNITTTTNNDVLRIIGANNNVWNNRSTPTSDLNVDVNHPMFLIDETRAFNWHISPQPDGIGTLTMDSPRTIEIHAALDAANFARNRINSSNPRVTNLGHLIAKVAELLGYHPNDNGEYIVADEKAKVRRIVKDEAEVDEAEYGGNYFASKGTLFKRVPNAFNASGEIVSGGVAMVHTIPELLSEMQDQLNIALNLQESGAIEIKDGDRTYRYSGQLQLLTDLALSVSAIHQLVHQGYISSLVTQQQSGEIIAGMGLPTVSRVTNIAIDNKLEQIPYWGIAPQHSLARKIDTVGYNVGIITGQLI